MTDVTTAEQQTEKESTIEEIIDGCTLEPLGPQIIILRDPVKEKTKGGIFLPNQDRSAKKKVTRGTVVRVGPGSWDPQGSGRRKVELRAGDRIVFAQYAGSDIDHPEEWGDQTYTLMQEAEILARISPNDAEE